MIEGKDEKKTSNLFDDETIRMRRVSFVPDMRPASRLDVNPSVRNALLAHLQRIEIFVDCELCPTGRIALLQMFHYCCDTTIRTAGLFRLDAERDLFWADWGNVNFPFRAQVTRLLHSSEKKM